MPHDVPMRKPAGLERITEVQFQSHVLQYARMRGWLRMHSRTALNQSGSWSTPISGDKGFPDLVLARDGVVIFIELKSARGRLGPGQAEWIEALGGEDGNAFIFRPADWDRIEALLR